MGLLSLAIWTPIAFGVLLLAVGRDEHARAVRWLALVAVGEYGAGGGHGCDYVGGNAGVDWPATAAGVFVARYCQRATYRT